MNFTHWFYEKAMNNIIVRVKNLSNSQGVKTCHTCVWKKRTWYGKLLAHAGLERKNKDVGFSKCTYASDVLSDSSAPKYCFTHISHSRWFLELSGGENNTCGSDLQFWTPFNSKERFTHKLKKKHKTN